MASGRHDRLSELPDDLLRRILHFVPLKEAASTTALSRRWRTPLWLSSGALNLETSDYKPRAFSQRAAFLSAAARTLNAADVPITRLALRLESDLHEELNSGDSMTWRCVPGGDAVSRYTNLIHGLLSHRAARHVEVLRIDAEDPDDLGFSLFDDRDRVGIYTVTLNSLPLETLRILQLTNCKGLLYHGAAVVLPRMSTLRMSHCKQDLGSLQHFMDSAPVLATVCLMSVRIDATDDENKGGATTPCRLRCPTASLLVLDSCRWKGKNKQARENMASYDYKKYVDVQDVEIDAPRLRRFRYKGPLRSMSFGQQPPELELVDLDFSGHADKGTVKDPDRDLATFWRFARGFSSTKEMRLRVNHLEDIAILSEPRRVELLPAFRRLKRLKVQGRHSAKGKDSVMAILNMLRCCPVLSALWINLLAAEAEHHDVPNKNGIRTRIPQKEIQIAALAPCHLLKCLQKTLQRVGLQFPVEKSDCLGVKLIKFFAENAKVLTKMHIDSGDEKLWEDMNPKTEKWNSKRRKSGATSFVVLPLKRCATKK